MIVKNTESKLELMAARQILASALASAFSDPRSPLALRCDGGDLEIVREAWLEIRRASGGLASSGLGLGERLPTNVEIEPLIGWLALPTERRERVHQRIFGLVMTKLCPAYETEYCAWKDATHRAQEMADIGGFYHAFGIQPSYQREHSGLSVTSSRHQHAREGDRAARVRTERASGIVPKPR